MEGILRSPFYLLLGCLLHFAAFLDGADGMAISVPPVTSSATLQTDTAAPSSRRRRRTPSAACNETALGIPCPSLRGGPLLPIVPWEATNAVRQATPISTLDTSTGNDLTLELRLVGSSLQALHRSGPTKSLTDFLRDLHGQLSSAAGVGSMQLNILGIHERFQRVARKGGTKHLEPRVLVRFRILAAGESAPQAVLERLREDLKKPEGKLQGGPLGDVFRNATIAKTMSSGLSIPRPQKDTLQRISAMALPIGISAAFTGILIWLAAW